MHVCLCLYSYNSVLIDGVKKKTISLALAQDLLSKQGCILSVCLISMLKK